MNSQPITIIFICILAIFFLTTVFPLVYASLGIHPKAKILRRIYYVGLIQIRRHEQEERYEREGILVCEVCGRTSEKIYICPFCNRCSDPECNAGCICCRRHTCEHKSHCRCCGHEL